MKRIKWQKIVILFVTVFICSCSVKDKKYIFKNISFHIPSGLVFTESIHKDFLQLYNKEKNLSITVYKVLPYQSKRNQEEVNDIFNKLAYNEERILKYDSDSLDTINREEDKVTFLRYFLQSDGSEDEKSGFIEAVSIFKADSEIWILSYMVPERNAYLLENILEYEKLGV